MAYCLRSFIETLDQVLNPHKHYKKWVLDHDHRPQIQSLFENATFLQHFLDHSSPLIQERIASLEDQIMDAAQKGADTLETIITDQILLNPAAQRFTILPPDMGEVIRVFEDAKQEVIKIEDASQPPEHILSPPVSSTHYPDSKNMVVGVEEDLNQLRGRLTSARVTKLDVIPIVGMGGMGKTTLAQLLYDAYSSSKSHFDCCAWATVSQSHDLQQILRTLLACVIGKPIETIPHQKTSDLITTLYQKLVGRRYLIVLDDIWSSKAWDDVQRAFARENKGSRVIFTTRENSLVDYVKSNSHEMHLINDDKSWELLRRKVFGEESCPQELEEVGKRIALKCGGIPLALQVIGGLLANSQRKEDFWEYVAHNVSSLIATTDDQFVRIFSLSFSHLPHYLKPCFLYIGAFREDYEIPSPRIIKLWVAEGFLYPLPNKSLEEAAEIHLNALVDRNLIFVRKRKWNGKAKSYGIHDLMRDLCLKKAQEKKFIYVKDSKIDILQEDILGLRRVSVYTTNINARYDYGSLKLTSFARSFLLSGKDESKEFVSRLCYKSSLLRVLDVYHAQILGIQDMLQQLVNLRYLAINNCNSTVSRGISILGNLQTLIVMSLESLAILEHLPQLRHLKFQKLKENSTYSFEVSPHENLRSLSQVPLHHLTYLLEKIPNLRKLMITAAYSDYDFIDLRCFQKLESLEVCRNWSYDWKFPQSLQKVELFSCDIDGMILYELGLVPGLRFLKLSGCNIKNSRWTLYEGQYCQLQHLEIRMTNLKTWLADAISFPVLRHLALTACHLSEIPYDIGCIETLETIVLIACSDSVYDSARTILKEQQEFGNTLLQLRIDGVLVEEVEE